MRYIVALKSYTHSLLRSLIADTLEDCLHMRPREGIVFELLEGLAMEVLCIVV